MVKASGQYVDSFGALPAILYVMALIREDPTERIERVQEATDRARTVRQELRRKSTPGSPERNARLDGAITDLSVALAELRRDAGRLQWSERFDRKYGRAIRRVSRLGQEERRSLRRMRRLTR